MAKVTHQDRIDWLALRPKLWRGDVLDTVANPHQLEELATQMRKDGLWDETHKHSAVVQLLPSLIHLAKEQNEAA